MLQYHFWKLINFLTGALIILVILIGVTLQDILSALLTKTTH
jgi:hypothetical protein